MDARAGEWEARDAEGAELRSGEPAAAYGEDMLPVEIGAAVPEQAELNRTVKEGLKRARLNDEPASN